VMLCDWEGNPKPGGK